MIRSFLCISLSFVACFLFCSCGSQPDTKQSETVMNCDALAVMCALRPGFVKSTVNTHARCITEQGETYSQVIFYKEGFTYDVVKNDFSYNVVLVTDVDKPTYFKNYTEAIKN